MPARPQPRFPESNSEPFWEGAKARELRYQQCNDCNAIIFYPRIMCTNCGSRNFTWRTSKGEGTVYTWSVIRQTRNPRFVEIAPYAIAYIDLDEGFRIMSTIVGVENPITDIDCGQRVRLEWEEQDTGEYPIPVFRPI